jgi:hypothetical protein
VAERAGINDFSKSFWASKNRLEAAFRVGIDKDHWTQAVDGVNRVMNDYQTMTPFGRKVLRPYLAPFWSFYRHATKTLLKMPYEHPASSNILRIIAQEEDDRFKRESGFDDMPGWMKGNALYLGKDTEAGDHRFLSTAGANPFNAITENPINLAHPALKMFYENQTGRSTFTGREFSDPNVESGGFGATQRYRIDPRTGATEPVDKAVPGVLEHMLQQVPQYEMVKDLVAGGSTYDTTTLISALRGRFKGTQEGLLVDEETGEAVNEKDLAQTVAKMLGYTEYSTDLAAFNERTLEERTAAFDSWLARNGGNTGTPSTPPTSGGSGGVSLSGG